MSEILPNARTVAPRRRIAGVLLLGLGSSAAIYLNADDPVESPFAEFENSKRFSHEVQRMGGKMSLVANDLTSWFDGLWQGRQLAWTVAFITLAIAVIYYVISSGPETGSDAGAQQNN